MGADVAAVGGRGRLPPGSGRLRDLLRPALPALAYGARLSASVCLSYYVAFWLVLDDAYWAGTSAAVAMQPSLGATRRKSGFRLLGTGVGAVFAVALTACFPQDRVGFLVGVALWGGACAFVNSLLTNFAAYAAALAGYTAAIIAAGVLDSQDQVFIVAVNRASAVVVGVAAVEVVVALTSLGRGGTQLAKEVASVVAAVWGHVAAELADGDDAGGAGREGLPALLKRVSALGTLIDTTVGEQPDIRSRKGILDAGVDGLFGALACWYAIHAQNAAEPAHAVLPPGWTGMRFVIGPRCLLADPADLRDRFVAAATELEGRAVDDPSARLMLDRTAECLRHLASALNAVALLVAPRAALPALGPTPRWTPPDLLPPLVNAVRVFLVIACAELIWVVTAWPGGTTCILFSFVISILLAARNEAAHAAAVGFTAGAILATVLVAVLKFAVLPQLTTFGGVAFWITACLLPVGALSQAPIGPKLKGIFGILSFLVTPLLQLVNEESYNTQTFYNGAVATVAGCLIAVAATRLVPAVPTAVRASRIVGAAWNDVGRLARRQVRSGVRTWGARMAARLATLPGDAAPRHAGQFIRAMLAGEEIDRLRASIWPLGLDREFEAAIASLACGDGATAAARLSALDERIAGQPAVAGERQARLRLRASVRGLAEASGSGR